MNKTELVNRIVAGPNEAHTKAAVEATLDALGDILADELGKGESIRLAGIGTFSAPMQAARQARNPRTGEHVDVPARRRVKFVPAQALKAAARGEETAE